MVLKRSSKKERSLSWTTQIKGLLQYYTCGHADITPEVHVINERWGTGEQNVRNFWVDFSKYTWVDSSKSQNLSLFEMFLILLIPYHPI